MKLIRYCCIGLGAALLTAALLLVVYNLREDRQSGLRAQETAQALRSLIPAPTEAPSEALPSPAIPAPTDAEPPEMPVLALDGEDYIGLLTVPSLELELPVRRSWSYEALRASPCRYAGSAEGGDLVIAAHNYRSHFGRIGELPQQTVLLFTDAAGSVYRYTVTETEQLPPTAVEDMRTGDAGDWDLTLFTCTLSGQSRVTVRCRLADE